MLSTIMEQAYAHCHDVASNHYENFPVASRLLPKRLRRPVSVIYAFARQADDLADEGDLGRRQRLDGLYAMQASLDRIADGAAVSPDEAVSQPLFLALAQVIEEHHLPLQPFYDLLSAFRMDVEYRPFHTFAQSLDYCRYSANPVGLLLLHLYRAVTPENIAQANALCSALQLINFYQDLAQDYHEQGRIYLPRDEMQRFGVDETHFRDLLADRAMQNLMALQTQRARQLLLEGAPLGGRLRGRIGLELRLIIQGGMRILHHLQQEPGQPFARPRLKKYDWALMIFNALRHRVC